MMPLSLTILLSLLAGCATSSSAPPDPGMVRQHSDAVFQQLQQEESEHKQPGVAAEGQAVPEVPLPEPRGPQSREQYLVATGYGDLSRGATICQRVADTAAVPLLLAESVPPEKGERIVNKQDADRIFAFNKAQWNAYAKQIGHPQDWKIRLIPHDTGTAVGAYDPKTGFGLSIQPLYPNDTDPPDMLIVGSHYPAGTFREFPESLKREIERETRADLGAGYDVSVFFQRFSPFGTAFDIVEITITRASK